MIIEKEVLMFRKLVKFFDECSVIEHLIMSAIVSVLILVFVFLPAWYIKYHDEKDVDYTMTDDFYVQEAKYEPAYDWVDDDDNNRHEPEHFYVQFYSGGLTFGREDAETYNHFKNRVNTRIKLEVKLKVRESYWKNKLTDSELLWVTISKEL